MEAGPEEIDLARSGVDSRNIAQAPRKPRYCPCFHCLDARPGWSFHWWMGDGSTEQLALTYRRATKIADDEVVRVGDVVRHWTGSAVETSSTMLHQGALVRVGGRWRVMLLATARDPRFVAAHELGHFAFRQEGVTFATSAAEERAANLFAAVLLAPRALVVRAYDHCGERLRPIAAGIGISQTSAALRLAEVLGDERAVVTRTQFVHLRGSTLTQERALAAARGKVPGLVKTRLRGGLDEGRVAVRVVG